MKKRLSAEIGQGGFGTKVWKETIQEIDEITYCIRHFFFYQLLFSYFC